MDSTNHYAFFLVIPTIILLVGYISPLANSEELAAPTCESFQCPKFSTVFKGKDMEIRNYEASYWMSTSSLTINNSFKDSTRAGFLELFGYVKGNNTESKEIPMTAPAVTDIEESCEKKIEFMVRLPLSDTVKNKPPMPLPEDEIKIHKLDKGWCAAVRPFGGFADDDNVVDEASKLVDNLSSTPWADHANASKTCSSSSTTYKYSVAQYNSPFEEKNRVNEIWLVWDLANGSC